MLSTSIAFAATLLAAVPSLAQSRDGGISAAQPNPGITKVRSKDGTPIAFERAGQGPVLVLVPSALAERSDAARLVTLLAPSFTVVHYDRRGRGDSGDTQPYAVRREIEDLEAVIEASGGSAYLFGASSGAVLALEAANALSKKVEGLILFEPPFVVDDTRPPIPAGLFAEIGALVDSGRRGDAVARFMVECVQVPEPMVAQMRASPMWRGLEELAHTLRYDGEVMAGLQSGRPLSKERWESVTARTLVLDGERSPAWLRGAAKSLADVLPGAKRRSLAGQDHSAPFLAPQVFVEPILELVSNKGGSNDREARDG